MTRPGAISPACRVIWTFGKRVKEADHFHLQGVIGHGNVAVFGHHHIYADETRIGGSGFKAQQRLRQHLLLRKAAQNLIQKEVNLHSACRSFIHLATAFALIAQLSAWSRAGVAVPTSSRRPCASNSLRSLLKAAGESPGLGQPSSFASAAAR